MDEEILKKICAKANEDVFLLDFNCDKSINELIIHDLIFSHDFAKAFWGEQLENELIESYVPEKKQFLRAIPSWKYHLQQMVLEEDPLKYLEKFL